MRKLSILGFAFLLAACAGLKPDSTKPAVDLPAGWRDAPADGAPARDARWRRGCGGPLLGRLAGEPRAHSASVVPGSCRRDAASSAVPGATAAWRPRRAASA